MLARHGVRVCLQLGDLGLLWPHENWARSITKLTRILTRNQQSFFWVDGNHEWHPKLLEFPIRDDGLRWMSANIAHLPRGYRTTFPTGKTLAALGGANSIDVDWRQVGESWWPEESISAADLATLGTSHADVLVGHEAPAGVPDPGRYRSGWSPDVIKYANASRAAFTTAVEQVRPLLTLSGHMHNFLDRTIEYGPPDSRFRTRVVVLDQNRAERVNTAILDTSSLELRFFYRNGYEPDLT
jgi:hypothetical protein